MLSTLAVLAALFQVPAAPPAAQEPSPERVPVVLQHCGDLALRDTLVRACSIWFDAGEFLVGEVPASQIDGLRARGIDVVALGAIAPDDELFAVDTTSPSALAELGGARILYRGGRQAIAAAHEGEAGGEHALGRRHTCHAGHAWFPRRAIAPAAPFAFQGVPWSGSGQALVVADPRVQAIVDQVVKANLQTNDQSLSSLFSRLSTNNTYIDNARNVLTTYLTGLGWTWTLRAVPGTQGDLVIVEIPGSVNPGKWVVVGAHYDSINQSGSTQTAPGGDDNASGSAAVMEIARILRTAGPFENSIRLVWFCGEEQGLLGSDVAAQDSQLAGETILGMLNTDMNAYRATGDARDVDFATNSTSSALTAFCRQVAPVYVSPWADTSGVLTAGSSDHASYNSHGFPSVFMFEDLNSFSPFIHTSGDTYASCTDWDLSVMITKGILSCAATLAEPLDLAIAHTELADTQDATGPYTVAAQITSLIGTNVASAAVWYSTNAGGSWSTVAMSHTGGSTWSADIPSQGSPVTIQYYIEAFDDLNDREVLPDGADIAGGTPFDFFVGTKNVFYATGFEEPTDNGWTHGQVQTQDDWQRGTPAGKSTDPGAAFSGAKCWGNDLGGGTGNGAYADNVNNWLRSPIVDCSGRTNVTLEFRRWLGVESGQFDDAQVKVNNVIVWSNPFSTDLVDSSWVPVSLDISAQAAGNPAVQIEFRMISDGGVTFGGWNVDEFSLYEVGPGTTGCPQPAVYCTAKVNSMGCTGAIGSSGTPSASAGSGFVVGATNMLNNKSGLFFYGLNGQLGAPFQGGFLCVKNPIKRTAVQSSNGNPPPNDCSGAYAFDFNAYIAGGTDPNLIAGTDVDGQYWARDPGFAPPDNTNLTAGIHFTICP